MVNQLHFRDICFYLFNKLASIRFVIFWILCILRRLCIPYNKQVNAAILYEPALYFMPVTVDSQPVFVAIEFHFGCFNSEHGFPLSREWRNKNPLNPPLRKGEESGQKSSSILLFQRRTKNCVMNGNKVGIRPQFAFRGGFPLSREWRFETPCVPLGTTPLNLLPFSYGIYDFTKGGDERRKRGRAGFKPAPTVIPTQAGIHQRAQSMIACLAGSWPSSGWQFFPCEISCSV
jgi:hypothetical protein